MHFPYIKFLSLIDKLPEPEVTEIFLTPGEPQEPVGKFLQDFQETQPA
jgi:hypothetical protein